MNSEEWKILRERSKQMALMQYATEASSIIHLTKDEISAIVDEAKVDQDKLSELIAVVDDATKSNNQKADAIKKIHGLAEVAVSLIGKLI